MKTQEELNRLKEEVESLNKKLAELNEEEIEQVARGFIKIVHSDSTLMVCDLCEFAGQWKGNYVGKTFERCI